MSVLRRAIEANRRISASIGRSFPQTRIDIASLYQETVIAQMARLGPPATIADVGGGRTCRFARHKPRGVNIIAIDVSEEELSLNRDVDEIRVGDCSDRIPLDTEEVDLIVSSSAMEHFPDVGRFVRDANRVLKPGGKFIHLFPSRFAPFAIVNRALPHRLARRLLHSVYPGTENVLGFRAYYDRCYASAFSSLLNHMGFHVDSCRVSYSQSWYFGFLVPCYTLSLTYELLVSCVGIKDLAAYVLISATKARPVGPRNIV